jgi:hypothetical protein
MGYRGGPPIPTDFTTRVVFRDIAPDHAIDVICRTGGARTVALAHPARPAGTATAAAARAGAVAP